MTLKYVEKTAATTTTGDVFSSSGHNSLFDDNY